MLKESKYNRRQFIGTASMTIAAATRDGNDIHTYVDVAPLLASKGYRVIVPCCEKSAKAVIDVDFF